MTSARSPCVAGDMTAPSVTPARARREGRDSDAARANPFARWHLSASALTCAAFTADGSLVAITGADGLCRVLNVASWERPALAGRAPRTLQSRCVLATYLQPLKLTPSNVLSGLAERWTTPSCMLK